MQGRSLCPRFAHTRSTPAELLLQQSERLFDLLPHAILPLDLCRLQFQIIGYPIALAILDDTHLLAHLFEMAAGLPEPLPPFSRQPLAFQQTTAPDARDMLPAQLRQQINDASGGVPTVKKHVFRLDSALGGFSDHLLCKLDLRLTALLPQAHRDGNLTLAIGPDQQ